tara:strand:- start:720 stop:2465 length:1746 start_codon:yes stop_codon:yes gene_type:complete
MSFLKSDLEKIKNKISLSSEIEKKTKLIKKGKDYWCCCLFHKEKTPSFKINEEHGSYYCFGCGAKGDIFNLYQDLYKYNFQDAVIELGKMAGINVKLNNFKKTKEENVINEILSLSFQWFNNNLNMSESNICNKYLKSRNISQDSIENFKLGYSFNSKSTLYNYLKEKLFKDEDILKSNVVKIDKKNNIRDYFFKRLIFPIFDERNNVVGFGGRSLDNSNPKYLNSPESFFFQKRKLLYNLSNAKIVARKKNNLLICEGYMDVISLFQRGIKSVVAPLGTAITEEQLNLAWKYSSKPTIMFDGDKAGLRASFKSALMSLNLISPNKFLQFVSLPNEYDPDSFINSFSIEKLLELFKNPIPLVNYIFDQSSKAVKLENADEKVSYDKYLEDLTEIIKDKKVKYFYKNEFKSLFFDKIKKQHHYINKSQNSLENNDISLYKKQILSFLASAINHVSNRKKIIDKLLKTDLFDGGYRELLVALSKKPIIDQNVDIIKTSLHLKKHKKIINECLKSGIYELFPYSSPKNDSEESIIEITKSCENLNTRLLKLKKINKSLDDFVKNSTQLYWNELQSINFELQNEE